MMKFQHTNI